MRLPIVARSRSQQRIECLLPLHVRLRADVFSVKISKTPKWCDQLLTCCDIARIKDCQHNHFFSMHVSRQEGKWGGFAKNGPDVQFLRRRFCKLAIALEYLFPLAQREHH